MENVKEDKIIKIDASSPLAQGLYKMAIHKRSRHQFRRGAITLEELNYKLREKNIPRYYEHSSAV